MRKNAGIVYILGMFTFIIILFFIGLGLFFVWFIAEEIEHPQKGILQNLETISHQLSNIEQNLTKQSEDTLPQQNRTAFLPKVGVIGSTWICNKCDTENPAISNSCKGCGDYR